MSAVWSQIRSVLSNLYFPKIQVIDVVEILIIAFLIYMFMAWIQRTRAYTLLKGILIVVIFVMIAAVFQMSAILWITRSLASIALIALVIIFQPELRKALESLGNKSIIATFLPISLDGSGEKNERFSDRTITEIIRAVNEMSEVRTGALIVIEQNILLNEYINTGIALDAEISSQLLINIFEHNTPLHDGAVVVRGNRIASATCYLPLSDNIRISKKYGTRHRAGLGISEASDSFTIIVSEETGRVSYAYMGVLTTGVTASSLREQLHQVQKRTLRQNGDRKLRIRKGSRKDEE
ncbi:MAG: diadenylate cyclase CdaA [Lachnospiraceae bacterium]|nr:diadenylate cyclase CdaA [Lachnospiraceae bacterium]